MDLSKRCGRCGCYEHEHDIASESRFCRYHDNCQLGTVAPFKKLPQRKPSDFLKKPETCKGCVLYGSGLGFSAPTGAGKEGILILAEALGEDEEREGKPLVGASGKQTQRMIARSKDPENGAALDLDRDCVRENLLRCKPPNNMLTDTDYELQALAHCSQYWKKTVAEMKPKAILALGNQPLRALTGQWGIKKLRGYVQDSPFGKVIGTYHPAFLLRGQQSLARVWQLDFLKALFTARGRTVEIPAKKRYILFPSGTDLLSFREEWRAAGRPLLAWDLETPYASALKDEEMVFDDDEDEDPTSDASYTILRASCSFAPFHSITFPWIEPFITIFGEMLAEAPETCGWNSQSFDIPRVENYGIRVGGLHIDGMHLWHYLEPALPMGLGYVVPLHFPDADAWKLEAKSAPELYSARDSCFTIRLLQQLIERAKREGHWGIFLEQFVELDKVLRKMTRRGILTDSEVRRAGREMFQAEFETIVNGLQPLIPREILPKHIYKSDETRLKKNGQWIEGRMVEVEVEEEYRAPKPKKLEWRVFYVKTLKKGPTEKSKLVKAFGEAEALALVPGGIRAIPSADSTRREDLGSSGSTGHADLGDQA